MSITRVIDVCNYLKTPFTKKEKKHLCNGKLFMLCYLQKTVCKFSWTFVKFY